VILGGLALFAVSSVVCAFAGSIEMLLFGRMLQGLTAGAGMVIGRAMVRDIFDGAEAQRLMARSPYCSPSRPPLRRSSAAGFSTFSTGMGSSVPRDIRHPDADRLLALATRDAASGEAPVAVSGTAGRAYGKVFSHHEFRRLALANAFNFTGLFIYVLAAPVFLNPSPRLVPRRPLPPCSCRWWAHDARLDRLGPSCRQTLAGAHRGYRL